jgi:hypothetical protein
MANKWFGHESLDNGNSPFVQKFEQNPFPELKKPALFRIMKKNVSRTEQPILGQATLELI